MSNCRFLSLLLCAYFLPDTTVRLFSSKETVTITYVDPSGDEHPVEAEIGQHLLDVAHDNNIELEGVLCYAERVSCIGLCE